MKDWLVKQLGKAGAKLLNVATNPTSMAALATALGFAVHGDTLHAAMAVLAAFAADSAPKAVTDPDAG